jgi:hypothetical protein
LPPLPVINARLHSILRHALSKARGLNTNLSSLTDDPRDAGLQTRCRQTIRVVLLLTTMREEPGPAPEDEDVQAAAEHAERAVEERDEMARKASKAEAADGAAESSELERESEQHGDASHEQEAEADESARDADSAA